MGKIGMIVAAVALAMLGATALITLTIFTFPKLKELIKTWLGKKKGSVVFGDKRRVLDALILKGAPTMKLEELSEDDAEYFIATYNEDTDEVNDFTLIKAEEVEEKVDRQLDNEHGIVVFE